MMKFNIQDAYLVFTTEKTMEFIKAHLKPKGYTPLDAYDVAKAVFFSLLCAPLLQLGKGELKEGLNDFKRDVQDAFRRLDHAIDSGEFDEVLEEIKRKKNERNH